MITTVYGTFHNATGSLSPAAVVADYISGADAEWREQMEATGALDAITADYADAINAALPNTIWLCGTEFLGPHHTDEDYDEDIDFEGFREIVDSIDLGEIVDRHEAAAHEAAAKAISEAADGRAAAKAQLAAADETLADAVHAALKLGIRAVAVAEMLGVTRARVYQIRGGGLSREEKRAITARDAQN